MLEGGVIDKRCRPPIEQVAKSVGKNVGDALVMDPRADVALTAAIDACCDRGRGSSWIPIRASIFPAGTLRS